jgi:hypothetical protein
MSQEFPTASRRRREYSVPGGLVTTDVYREHSRPVFWMKYLFKILFSGGFSASGPQRDIVVMDSTRARELYREGPYDGITTPRAFQRIVREIEQDGLDVFLCSNQIRNQRIGPVSVASGQGNPIQIIAPWVEMLTNKFSRKRTDNRLFGFCRGPVASAGRV